MRFGTMIVTLAALALAPQAAMAQAVPPAAAPAPDPANLAVSQQIIAILLPPDQRLAMVRRMQEAITAPMRANMQLPPELNDPGLTKLLHDYLDTLPGLMSPVLAEHMPALADAMARAYARTFTHGELEQILAFARTPAGGKYFLRSSTLLQDPDVAAVNGQLFRAGQEIAVKTSGQLQTQIRAYIAAHPDVAKRLNAAAAARKAP